MNYKKIHDSIINKAKERTDLNGYTENHHITPKSMGGHCRKSNMVRLTAREHFLIHWLLKKIHKNVSMTYAFFAMTKMGNSTQKRYTSHSFKYAREAMCKHLSESMSGENNYFYGLYGKDNPHYGMKRSYEARSNISKSRIGMTGEKNGRSIKVKNMSTGEVFDSVRLAQAVTSGNVYYAASNDGTANGDKYRFIDESGNEINPKVKLKGYRSGANSPVSKKVLNVTSGNVFPTIKLAADGIGKTASAVSWGLRHNKPVGGFWFKRI